MVRKTKSISKKKEEKVALKDKICRRCVYAYLMQSSKVNPIVSECTKTKQRFVASSPHSEECCFKENKEEITIHEMIYLK